MLQQGYATFGKQLMDRKRNEVFSSKEPNRHSQAQLNKKHKTTKLVKFWDSKFADTDSLNDENTRETLLNIMTLLFKIC